MPDDETDRVIERVREASAGRPDQRDHEQDSDTSERPVEQDEGPLKVEGDKLAEALSPDK